MCVYAPGTKVMIKSENRRAVVERMEDTPPGSPRRVVINGASRPASDVAPLVGPWDKGDK